MQPLSEAVSETLTDAWDDRESIVVLTTVNLAGIPNSIYVGVVGRYDDTTFFVANNFFDKTRQNILETGRGSLLFLTQEKKILPTQGITRTPIRRTRLRYHEENQPVPIPRPRRGRPARRTNLLRRHPTRVSP